MRDPSATLHFEKERVVRSLKVPSGSDQFLRSALAKEWVSRGDLIPYEFIDAQRLSSPRYEFVSYPYEWSDRQHHEAAQLTLRMQREANEAGFDLKDASAWNVIFDGTRPVFCDLTSLEPLRDRTWWAAGQFARHFIFPRLLSRHAGLEIHHSFACWRDGVPVGPVRQVLGWRRFLTRYMPMLAAESSSPVATQSSAGAGSLREFRAGLNAWMAWALRGVAPRESEPRSGPWADYVEQRDHYAPADVELKRETVRNWLARIRPAKVLDLGCNSGEFSEMAVELGARVVAVDGDAQAIDRLVRRWQHQSAIHPVIATLDDLVAGRGWSGMEYEGLVGRLTGKTDLVLMLALIHHLTIGASVPIEHVARWVTQLDTRWLIVECLGPDDAQVQSLCSHRRRDPAEFTLQAQLDAFGDQGWRLEAQCDLIGGHRRLCLFERIEAGS